MDYLNQYLKIIITDDNSRRKQIEPFIHEQSIRYNLIWWFPIIDRSIFHMS